MSAHEEVFLKARQITDAVERAAYLEKVYAGHDAQRAAMEQMLHDAGQADAFFEVTAIPSSTCAEGAGSKIGRYQLLEKIGEGGMGIVYLAEQREPVARKVALKIIKVGMDTRQVIARFEAERQALAMMDHPNIARVLDGGETDNGRPYFVMDLVQGLPITQFCDERQLAIINRLDLFLDVCSAIQHAHQKGIIHRDIKPSNILVTAHTGRPVPKVIDFGIAKATQQPLTEKTLFTQFEYLLGTPAYMSPEQANFSGFDIDTRSDVYALGVLLYELLTGTTPFDGKELLKSGLDAMRRTIQEEEPPRPSARVAWKRAKLPPEGHTPAREFDADLDWIVMKCLEKEPARRYGTANGLATDLRRHLSDEPVAARPPSFAYRWRKAVVRHRLAFGAAAFSGAILVSGFAVSTWLLLEEQEARRRAVAAEKVQAELRSVAETARRKAEAGQTALLYWQAFDSFPRLDDEERNRVASMEASDAGNAMAARYDKAFELFFRAAGINAGCDWAANVEAGPDAWVPRVSRIREAISAACLRARVALSKGQADAACRDLLSTFILGRHVAVDGSLVSVMTQCEVESRVVQFMAENFGGFPSDVLGQFSEGVRKAPMRSDAARGARMEKRGGAQWLVDEIRKAQIEAAGDEVKALQRAREVLAEGVGPGVWADRTITAAGDSSAGLIAYIQEAVPYYRLLERMAAASPADLEAETASVAQQIESSTNLVVQRILPNLNRARRREMEALTRLAMLQGAIAYRQRGSVGFQSVRDPFGDGPFEQLLVADGFQLRSKISDYGYDGTLNFVNSAPK